MRMRTVHHRAQHRRNGGYVRRFVLRKQPRQPHQLTVPVEHFLHPLASSTALCLVLVPFHLQIKKPKEKLLFFIITIHSTQNNLLHSETWFRTG